MNAAADPFDIAVVGGGPAGLVAAIAAARGGAQTILIAGPRPADNRATALLHGSVEALETLGVWSACAAHASPLRVIRLIDNLGGLLRAPETIFHADEIGLDAFGHNIENRDLVAVLAAEAGKVARLAVTAGTVTGVTYADDAAILSLADGSTLRAALVIGADGRESLCRTTAGIDLDRTVYPQAAVSCTLAHARPHGDISTEFHTPSGPFTLVPLGGHHSSLVWVVEPERAPDLKSLAPDAFGFAVERQARSILGKMRLVGERLLFPLASQTARKMSAPRLALVGEAAHIMPPIGAQGFNLGLRDAVAIGGLAADALRDGRDPGAADVTGAYERARRGDVSARVMATDLLNRSLLSDFLPIHAARRIGLSLVNRIAPLRRALMRQGIGTRL